MKILIDILHPAHVHFFKIPYLELKKLGHEVFFTTRDINVAQELMDSYDIPYTSTGPIGQTAVGLIKELLKRNLTIKRIIRKEKIDVLVGIGGISIALVGFLLRKPRLIFNDTEVTGLTNKIAFPLATKIYTPIYFNMDLGKKHKRYNGFQEYSYLNKNYFKPDMKVLTKYNLKSNQYSICRFCAWKASHDINQSGISDETKIKIVNELLKHGDVLISAEKGVPKELEKYRFQLKPHEFHTILSQAKLLVSETSTVTTEAALLGVPVVRSDSLVGTNRGAAGNMNAFEEAGLQYNIRDENKAFEKIKEIINDENYKENSEILLRNFLKGREDVVEFIVQTVLEYEK